MKTFSIGRLAATAVGSFALVAMSAGPALADEFAALMSGANETPVLGDPDGFGVTRVTLSNSNTRLCYQIYVRNIAPATLAHIHRGAAGVPGPVVVNFTPPTFGVSQGCTSIAQSLGDEIEANPELFYSNVHNAQFPGGAVRGQLFAR